MQKLLSGGLVATGDGGGVRLEIDTLIAWFVSYAASHTIPEAIKQLEKYLDATEVTYLAVTWVAGIEAEKVVKLASDTDLVPAHLMPDNSDREYFGRYEFNFLDNRTIKPKVALMTRSLTPKILAKDPSREEEASINKQQLVYQSLSDHSLLLNLIPNISCMAFYSTGYLEESTPPGLFGGRSGTKVIQDIPGTYKINHLTKTILTQFHYNELSEAFNSLSNKERDRWRLIISRLSQAKRRSNIVDKILDLGIAMEMAIIGEPNYKEQVSLTFRLRGAHILTNNLHERKEIYSSLKKIYAYRSKAAHNGAIEDVNHLRSSIHKYEILASEVCSKILLQGEKINWEEVLLS